MASRTSRALVVTLVLATGGTGACASGEASSAAEGARADASGAAPAPAPAAGTERDAGSTSSFGDTRRLPAGDPPAPTSPSCPPDAPFVCPADNARGYACSETACAPSCERIGCPSGFTCLDCGAGPECVPARHACD